MSHVHTVQQQHGSLFSRLALLASVAAAIWLALLYGSAALLACITAFLSFFPSSSLLRRSPLYSNRDPRLLSFSSFVYISLSIPDCASTAPLLLTPPTCVLAVQHPSSRCHLVRGPFSFPCSHIPGKFLRKTLSEAV